MPERLEPRSEESGVADGMLTLLREWIASRPPSVRALADEFPIGSVLTDHKDVDWYVIGWGEPDSLIISPCWIGDNYDMSTLMKHHICVDHSAGRLLHG